MGEQSVVNGEMSVPEGFEATKASPQEIEPFECIDVPVGAYAVFDKEDPTPIRPLRLKTDGYTECVCALVSVIDDTGEPVRWGLAHISMQYDPVAAVNIMEQALRPSDSNLRMQWDLVGGRTNRDWQGAGDFAQAILAAVDKLNNVSINNFLFDPRARGEISVDLATGRKFVGPADNRINSDIIDYIRYELYKGEYKQWFLETAAANPKTEGGLILPRYMWQEELPELQNFWQNPEKRGQIMNKIRQARSNN